jgi:carboxymethylenebutenolidase
MCFPPDALPPIRPIAGAAVDSEDIVLTSGDGTRFAAFAARAGRPGGPGVVVMPDVRGLFRFYEELALSGSPKRASTPWRSTTSAAQGA